MTMSTDLKEVRETFVPRGPFLLSWANFGNLIRTLMPLVITDEQLQRGLSIMEEGLAGFSK